jgi:hypothetical protein
MGEALKQFHPEDIEVTETRVGRKHEVTAIHKPTGISVTRRTGEAQRLHRRLLRRVTADSR